MTVQAELGIVGEIGAEFQEEGAKVPIYAVDVKVVDLAVERTSQG